MQITSDGQHALLDRKPTGKVILYVAGNFAGATAEVGYVAGDESFVALGDGLLESGKQYNINKGVGINLIINVTGATGSTNIDIMSGYMD